MPGSTGCAVRHSGDGSGTKRVPSASRFVAMDAEVRCAAAEAMHLALICHLIICHDLARVDGTCAGGFCLCEVGPVGNASVSPRTGIGPSSRSSTSSVVAAGR